MIPKRKDARQVSSGKNRQRRRKVDHVRLLKLSPSEIAPSPENDKLYSPIDPKDPDFVQLVESVRRNGILEPPIASVDRMIISGHRRREAAILAGLSIIPVRIRTDIHSVKNRRKFLRMLREANRQRVKTVAEMAREQVMDANPADAYKSLIAHRQQQSNVAAATMDLGDWKTRKGISAAKFPMLNAIKKVLEERRPYWPISDRAVHYALLNSPPLIHAGKPNSIYKNDLKSYRACVDLLARARLERRISWDAIADETRPVTLWTVHQHAGAFIRDQLDGLMKGYWRNLLQSQPNHIELVCEKNTLMPILRGVAAKYCLPVTSGRGYSSLPPRKAMAERWRASGKDKLIVLMVSDFDPDGEMIAQSFARSLRDDFGVYDVEAVKCALTAAQVKEFELPPGLKAKAGCSTRDAFVEQHGEHVFEVEALEPAELQRIVSEKIDSVLDVKAFNAELEKEKTDAGEIETVRRRMISAIGGAK